MSAAFLQSIPSAIIVLALGIFVYLNNRKSQLNISFFLFTLTAFWWLTFFGIAYLTNDKYNAKFFIKIGYVGVIFIVITSYHFIATFLRRNSEKKFVILSYLIGLIFVYLLLFTDLFMKRVSLFHWGYYPIQGTLHPMYMTFLCLLVLRFIYLLFKDYKDKHFDTLTRNRAKYILLASIVFSFAAIDFLPGYNLKIYPFGFIFVLLYSGLVGYAILRHQLLEIEVIIKKTIVFAGLFAVVFAILVLPTLIIQEFIVAKMGLGGKLIGISISTVLLVLILRPLENLLRRITDRYLFQKKYDYRKLLRTFTNEVLTVVDLHRLTHLTVHSLSDIIKLVSCGILLLDEEKDGYGLATSYGIENKDIFLKRGNTLISFLERTHTHLLIGQQRRDTPIPENVIEDMKELKLELATPLIVHRKMIGILVLGKKKSDEAYTHDDIDILMSLARSLAIAISNAELFDELSKTQAEAAQREKMAVIGTLSAGINHEICNPLGIVRGKCEAFLLNLKDGFYKGMKEKELLNKATEIMDKIIKEVDRATAVTRRLSGFAKPIKEMRLDEVNIKDEIDEVMSLVGHELELEKIDVVKEIPDDLPNISADRRQIEEIFFNLIRNAGQAVGEKGRITIRAKNKANDKILIKIEDTGHGIPEDDIEKIFDPFYTTREPGRGTGLGLFIVRQIVERNNGNISVRSKVGTGTTFILEFPAIVKAEA